MKKKYVLLTGSHSTLTKSKEGKRTRITYKKGDVIESEIDLIKAFKNKFALADNKNTTTEQKLSQELEEELEEEAKEKAAANVVKPKLSVKMIAPKQWTIINEDGDEVIEGHISKKEALILKKELSEE